METVKKYKGQTYQTFLLDNTAFFKSKIRATLPVVQLAALLEI